MMQTEHINSPGRLILTGEKVYTINSIDDCLAEIDIGNPQVPVLNHIVPSRLLEKVYGIAQKNDLLYLVGRDSGSFIVIDPRKL